MWSGFVTGLLDTEADSKTSLGYLKESVHDGKFPNHGSACISMASIKYLLSMAIEHIKNSLLKNLYSILPPPTGAFFFPYKANNFSMLIREKDRLYVILFL